MRRILSISTLAIMLVLIALPAVATGKHNKPEVSSMCDTLTITADKKMEWTAYIGDGDVTMKGSYTFSHGQPGQYWAVVYKEKVIAEGQFEGCNPTTTTTPEETTTTLPVTTTVPFETIQVCRDGVLIFIDPMERLESDTDECEIPEETTTTTPVTTTVAPTTTAPVATTAAVEAKVLPFTGISDYLPILAGGLVMFGALLLSFMGRNKEVADR
jgi:hypothetical protein